MTEEETNSSQDPTAEQVEPEEVPLKRTGFSRYLLFGGVGIVIVVAVAMGTLMLVGKDAPEPPLDDSDAIAYEGKGGHPDSATGEEGVNRELLDRIVQNLDALSYEPDPSEIEGDAFPLTAEDSLEALSWLEKEKAALGKREKDLRTWEKDLKRRESDVARKILRLEEVESERVTGLARLYDAMEPRAVARLMANLDDDTVVAILPRMKTKNASEVLQLLPARRAARLSKQMITIAGS